MISFGEYRPQIQAANPILCPADWDKEPSYDCKGRRDPDRHCPSGEHPGELQTHKAKALDLCKFGHTGGQPAVSGYRGA